MKKKSLVPRSVQPKRIHEAGDDRVHFPVLALALDDVQGLLCRCPAGLGHLLQQCAHSVHPPPDSLVAAPIPPMLDPRDSANPEALMGGPPTIAASAHSARMCGEVQQALHRLQELIGNVDFHVESVGPERPAVPVSPIFRRPRLQKLTHEEDSEAPSVDEQHHRDDPRNQKNVGPRARHQLEQTFVALPRGIHDGRPALVGDLPRVRDAVMVNSHGL
mmetsp:Transcript_43233/g.119541  ORF Transcript_43233/g.119541 Transcript_43233/m.119541 type:complete len:218 (+) Transcript_43233:559-1212(+)